MKVYTIGFTQRHARDFFEALKAAGIRRLIDVRLSNSSQLAGFTKRVDLPYFLQEICGAEYHHETLLAPTDALRGAYQKNGGDWPSYERGYLALLKERRVEERLDRGLFDGPAVLLCSERSPDQCHRRLALDYLRAAWGGFESVHL